MKKFERDFKEVKNRFPKLSYFWNSELKWWVIRGDIDICDIKGIYWNTFNVSIGVPTSYPNCVPIVIENSNLIPREIEWHISPEGICCIDIGHNLIAMSKRGINIFSFIKEKVYPYLANQIFKLENKKYAGEEYLHHFDGVIQYYNEDHKLPTIDSIIVMLERIMSSKIGRNESCPCRSGKKVKECHIDNIKVIASLGKEKLSEDLKRLKERKKNDL